MKKKHKKIQFSLKQDKRTPTEVEQPQQNGDEQGTGYIPNRRMTDPKLTDLLIRD